MASLQEILSGVTTPSKSAGKLQKQIAARADKLRVFCNLIFNVCILYLNT